MDGSLVPVPGLSGNLLVFTTFTGPGLAGLSVTRDLYTGLGGSRNVINVIKCVNGCGWVADR